MATELKVLILDAPEPARDMVVALEGVGFVVDAAIAANEREFRRALGPGTQVILADPANVGARPVLRVLETRGTSVPVVLTADAFDGQEALHVARDYVPKQDLGRLGAAVRRVLEEEAQERERRMLQSRRRLREAQRAVEEAGR